MSVFELMLPDFIPPVHFKPSPPFHSMAPHPHMNRASVPTSSLPRRRLRRAPWSTRVARSWRSHQRPAPWQGRSWRGPGRRWRSSSFCRRLPPWGRGNVGDGVGDGIGDGDGDGVGMNPWQISGDGFLRKFPKSADWRYLQQKIVQADGIC